MACSVPVLLLAFNRPEQTRMVLEQIRRAAPAKLYVHCDGVRPHVAADAERVGEVRRIIEAFQANGGIEMHLLFRECNEGLRKGVFGALNWFFNQEECGIVLEDDCVPDLTMFPFCAELLGKYRHNEQIMHIGCSNLLPGRYKLSGNSYVFSKFSLVWGWASWRRAWQKMEIGLDGLDEFERSGRMARFLSNPMAQEYMLDKFRRTRAGQNNSWAYAWFFSILKNNGLCLISSTNLVQNRGIGAEATHTTGRNKRAQLRAQPARFPLVHPMQTQVDRRLEMQFFYATQKTKHRLWLWYVLHQLKLR